MHMHGATWRLTDYSAKICTTSRMVCARNTETYKNWSDQVSYSHNLSGGQPLEMFCPVWTPCKIW